MSTGDLKYREKTWDLQNADTKEYTHCFHTYPAMMIPQIARKLLRQYGVEGGWLFDPYCGTGTSGQFSRLAAEWIGLPNARKIDKLAMGGQHSKEILTDSPVKEAIAAIKSIDEKRSREVSAFYIDLGRSIDAVAQVLSPNATICYVVGNRRVKEVMLPTDAFIVTAFRRHGFTHKATIVRNIPNKRMPKKNSPSNVAGETSTTMHEENIVICQRTTHTCL